jgi:hypothetical protein
VLGLSELAPGAARLDQLALAAPREPRIEEQILRHFGHQSRAKFPEDQGIAPGSGALQAQDVCPVDAAAHTHGYGSTLEFNLMLFALYP